MGAPKGTRWGGRAKGTPNRSTVAAREAIGRFVDANAHRLQEWLDKVANGLPQVDENGVVIPGKWLVPPNPLNAANLLNSMVEYHIPKLARTEVTGKDGEALFPNENRAIIEGEVLKLVAPKRLEQPAPADVN